MLYSAIILGIVGSLHCIGMCGPIAFMLPVDRTNKVKRILQIFIYHLGRLTTYSLIGLVFGLLGRGFEMFDFQQQLSIFVGIIMILSVLIPKLFQKIEKGAYISRIVIKLKSALGKELKQKRTETFFAIGFINGFLPCGVLYMAIFGAIGMHNPLLGSLYMFLFGIGTIPLMTAVAFLGTSVNVALRNRIQRLIPIVVIFVGVLFIIRGLGLGNSLSPSVVVSNLVEASINCFR